MVLARLVDLDVLGSTK